MVLNKTIAKAIDLRKHELWKDVIGYEGLYQISNIGRVKSLSHKVPSAISSTGFRTVLGRILKQSNHSQGYLTVTLCKNGVSKTKTVHRLELIVFDKSNQKEMVNHKDGNKNNNLLENLEWVTRQENVIHAFKTGLIVARSGYIAHNRKLSDAEYDIITNMYLNKNSIDVNIKITHKSIARIFGVSESTIRAIIHSRKKVCEYD